MVGESVFFIKSYSLKTVILDLEKSFNFIYPFLYEPNTVHAFQDWLVSGVNVGLSLFRSSHGPFVELFNIIGKYHVCFMCNCFIRGPQGRLAVPTR